MSKPPIASGGLWALEGVGVGLDFPLPLLPFLFSLFLSMYSSLDLSLF